ncbi:hypothetical protein Tco_0116555 [Tanacetum coccineum]
MQTQMGRLDEAFQERPLGVLPSDNETYPREERKAVTTMSGLTLDGSFIPYSNFLVYQEKEQEPETITKVVEIASSKSTPLVTPPKTPPLSTPKPKKNLEPNPYQPMIPYPPRLQEEKFQALENPTGHADHFVYRIHIVDSLYDKLPIENNSLSGNPTPSSDLMVESLSSLPTPFEDSDSLVEETDTLLSQIDDSFPEYETFCFDIKEKSSCSTSSHSNHSLPEYESFYFDHIEEKSSGSTTIRSDYSLPGYDAFYFDNDYIEEKSSGSTTTHYDFLFLNMIRLSLIFRLINFHLPIGVTFIMRSSPMNSITSYLHRKMRTKFSIPGYSLQKDFTLNILWDYLIGILKLSKLTKNLKARWRFSHSSSSSTMEGTSLR